MPVGRTQGLELVRGRGWGGGGAIAIWFKHFAPDHPNFAAAYNNLAAICYHEGDRAATCANLKKALGILLKHFDENHPNVKITRESMQIAGCGK